ncbi:uncharacterized protein LOC107847078 isoform X1 [Capsicum annuum]|uniref:uncharacterized protein LOC107847078 isoform X1 n=1 Tax=Capsicum annuum TaxID=4072 RepID=UPI0007BF2AD3|nr:uncharacterized protein LOC107847078 isoform X1 [Capsicum annuum]
MNHKTLFILFFVLIFCLSSTMASRRLLSGGNGGSKIGMLPNPSRSAPSATEQPPPVSGGKPLTYRALQKPICNGKVYASCIGRKVPVRRCNLGERCEMTP